MKNIVVLKNVPSNLVDEAILILKPNKNAKKLEYACKSSSTGYKDSTKNNDYVVKEAESVIANYISKVEKNKPKQKENTNFNKKYKRLKIYSIVVSIILTLAVIKTMF